MRKQQNSYHPGWSLIMATRCVSCRQCRKIMLLNDYRSINQLNIAARCLLCWRNGIGWLWKRWMVRRNKRNSLMTLVGTSGPCITFSPWKLKTDWNCSIGSTVSLGLKDQLTVGDNNDTLWTFNANSSTNAIPSSTQSWSKHGWCFCL